MDVAPARIRLGASCGPCERGASGGAELTRACFRGRRGERAAAATAAAGGSGSGARVSSCRRRKFRTGFSVLASRPSLSSPDRDSSAPPELSEGVPSSLQRRPRSLVKHSPQLHEWKSAPQVSRGRRTGRAGSLPHWCPLSILAPNTSGAVSVRREGVAGFRAQRGWLLHSSAATLRGVLSWQNYPEG